MNMQKTIFYLQSLTMLYRTAILLTPILSKKYLPMRLKIFILKSALFIQGYSMEYF